MVPFCIYIAIKTNCMLNSVIFTSLDWKDANLQGWVWGATLGTFMMVWRYSFHVPVFRVCSTVCTFAALTS
jgi:hypothetical protein